MVANNLITHYSVKDYTHALKQLLPPGKYWQTADNPVLDKMLSAIATDFKQTEDDTRLTLLYQAFTNTQSWKVTDYQAILDLQNFSGTVYDSSASPNVIFINFDGAQRIGGLIQYLESYRLPHTCFNWTAQNEERIHVAATNKQYKIERKQDAFDLTQIKSGRIHTLIVDKTIIVTKHQMRAP